VSKVGTLFTGVIKLRNLEKKMSIDGSTITFLQTVLDNLKAALVDLDIAKQHSEAARLDQIIHDVEAKISAASGTS
jgi:hypothetical protein